MSTKDTDWVSSLDSKSQENLKKILTMIIPYRPFYENAKDPANAQLWMAITELLKKIEFLEKKIENLEKKLSNEEDDKRSVLEDLDNY